MPFFKKFWGLGGGPGLPTDCQSRFTRYEGQDDNARKVFIGPQETVGLVNQVLLKHFSRSLRQGSKPTSEGARMSDRIMKSYKGIETEYFEDDLGTKSGWRFSMEGQEFAATTFRQACSKIDRINRVDHLKRLLTAPLTIFDSHGNPGEIISVISVGDDNWDSVMQVWIKLGKTISKQYINEIFANSAQNSEIFTHIRRIKEEQKALERGLIHMSEDELGSIIAGREANHE